MAWCLIKHKDKNAFTFKHIVSTSSDWMIVNKKSESMWNESIVL
jgi:hypothetical protein